MTLDHSQPFDEVFGLPGVKYSQGGILYDSVGHPVTYHRDKTAVVDGAGDPVDHLVVVPIVPKAKPPVVRKEAVAGGEDDGLEGMHYRYLQTMMDQYGEPYTGKAEAIAFLRGKARTNERPAPEADPLAAFRE